MRVHLKLKASKDCTHLQASVKGEDVLRARLPPLGSVRDRRAVTKLLEGLSDWLGGHVCVALCADDKESCFQLELTDALGEGVRDVFYSVKVVSGGRRPILGQLGLKGLAGGEA